jgi:hypothetical protein
MKARPERLPQVAHQSGATTLDWSNVDMMHELREEAEAASKELDS